MRWGPCIGPANRRIANRISSNRDCNWWRNASDFVGARFANRECVSWRVTPPEPCVQFHLGEQDLRVGRGQRVGAASGPEKSCSSRGVTVRSRGASLSPARPRPIVLGALCGSQRDLRPVEGHCGAVDYEGPIYALRPPGQSPRILTRKWLSVVSFWSILTARSVSSVWSDMHPGRISLPLGWRARQGTLTGMRFVNTSPSTKTRSRNAFSRKLDTAKKVFERRFGDTLSTGTCRE